MAAKYELLGLGVGVRDALDRASGRRPRLLIAAVLAFLFTLVGLLLWPLDIGSLPHHPDKHFTRCRPVSGWTTHVGGTPGYEVFEHVWFRGGVFYMYTPEESALPSEDEILTGQAVRISTQSPEARVPDACFKGTTVFFNEGAGPEPSRLSSYYAFILENVLGAYTALSNSARGADANVPVTADTVVIPWDGRWRINDINGNLSRALWGKNVVEAKQWARLSKKDKWVYFEKIAIVDRGATHRSAEVSTWGHMAMAVLQARHHRTFWATARLRVRRAFHVPFNPRRREHHIVYVDSQHTHQRVLDREHDALVHALTTLAKERGVAFSRVQLPLSPGAQLQAIAQGTVLIGVHSAALEHLVWMQDGAAVIELLPPDVVARDYEAPSTALGYHYTAIRGSELLTKEQWDADPGEKNRHLLEDGTAARVHVPLLVKTVRAALDRAL